MVKKIFGLLVGFARKYKVWASLILIVAGGIGYFGIKALTGESTQVSYVLAAVENGAIISSVSGSGQVSASSQVDIKPKVSGDVLNVLVKNGQEVKTSELIAQLNARDALQAVREAQISLETAQLSLEKLKAPADALSLMQSEHSLLQAQESKQNAEANLGKSYDDGFNTVANAFLDLPSVITGLHDILLGHDYSGSQDNGTYYTNSVRNYNTSVDIYKNDAFNTYQAARVAYDQNFSDYKALSRFSDYKVVENLVKQTYETTKKIAEAVKATNNFIQFYQGELTKRAAGAIIPALSNTHLSSLNSYTGKTNSHLSSLLNITQSIKNSKETIITSERTIAEKTQSLANLKSGPDSLDLRNQELSVQQRQNALRDAQSKLSDYSIRAPFDGVIASVSVKKGDSISSGSAVVTLITKQKLAEISLNEIDVAKVKVGQKANITFDAIDELNITGEVSDLDLIGTVTQGVVTYNVKIVFDTQDDRVKTGMSLSASIITEIKQDVLLIPNGAIKSQGGMNYIEILPGATLVTGSQGVVSAVVPARQIIELGLTDDTNTEAMSGLKEGDLIIIKTIASNTSSQPSSAPSLLQSVGASRGGATTGGAGRTIMTR